MVRTVLAQLSALAALIIGALFAIDLDKLPNELWKLAITVLAVAVWAILACLEVRRAWRGRAIHYRGRNRNEKIASYMASLLGHDGQCVVSSNDLSWVQGRAREAMVEKAQQRSLVLVMPMRNILSSELESKGAVAYYYGDDDFKFSSRFTLVNYSRADAWIAIGFGDNSGHTIREVHKRDDPTVFLADDLIRLAKRSTTRGPAS